MTRKRYRFDAGLSVLSPDIVRERVPSPPDFANTQPPRPPEPKIEGNPPARPTYSAETVPVTLTELLTAPKGNTTVCQRCSGIAKMLNIPFSGKNVRYCAYCLKRFQERLAEQVQVANLGIGDTLSGPHMFDNDPHSPPYSVTLTAELIEKTFKPLFK